jgi:hypothetical protein
MAEELHVQDKELYEGQSTVGECQGGGRVVAWERHGICESALNIVTER